MKRYIIFLVFLLAAEIALSLYLTAWRENFWNAVALKDSSQFLKQVGIFSGVALTLVFIVGYSGYLVNLSVIKCREILNTKAIKLRHTQIENVNQRIQEDSREYPDLMFQVWYGLVKAVCYVVVFSTSILMAFQWWYLAALVVYSLIGTFITRRIAMPLVSLNYKTQQAEATYRNSLTHRNFVSCVLLMGSMAVKQKYLSYFQSFYGQVAVVIPLILIAPEYFTSAMTVGLLMRFNSLSSTIMDNLSYGITSFGTINKLLSCKKRLQELKVIK